jgi:hypothetical protein
MVYPRETAQASARAGSRLCASDLQPRGRLPSPFNLQPRAQCNLIALLFLWLATSSAFASAGSIHTQRSYEEWHRLTSSNAPPPKVLARDDQVRIYFPNGKQEILFSAKLSPTRIREPGLHVSLALLKLSGETSKSLEPGKGWRPATVIIGPEWKQLVTNLVISLTPAKTGRGVYYRGLAGDHFLYRDTNGISQFAPLSAPPKGVTIDRRYSMEETLKIMGDSFEVDLVKSHPSNSLFLILAPSSQRRLQPMFLDRDKNRCVWLSPKQPRNPRRWQSARAWTSHNGKTGWTVTRTPIWKKARSNC